MCVRKWGINEPQRQLHLMTMIIATAERRRRRSGVAAGGGSRGKAAFLQRAGSAASACNFMTDFHLVSGFWISWRAQRRLWIFDHRRLIESILTGEGATT